MPSNAMLSLRQKQEEHTEGAPSFDVPASGGVSIPCTTLATPVMSAVNTTSLNDILNTDVMVDDLDPPPPVACGDVTGVLLIRLEDDSKSSKPKREVLVGVRPPRPRGGGVGADRQSMSHELLQIGRDG